MASAKLNNPYTRHGKMALPLSKSGGSMKESKKMMKKEISFFKKKGAPKSMIKHEQAEMKSKFAEGGSVMRGTGAATKGKRSRVI